jgi:uncharacterized protein YkvS
VPFCAIYRCKEVKNQELSGGSSFMVDEVEFGKVSGQVGHIVQEMDKIGNTIYGNGKDGLTTRMSKVEDNLVNNTDTLEELVSSVDALTTSVEKVSDNLGKKVTIPSLIREATLKVIFGLIGIGIIFNMIANLIIPKDISIWDILSRMLF